MLGYNPEKVATVTINGKVEPVDHYYIEDGKPDGRLIVILMDGREFYVDTLQGVPCQKQLSLSDFDTGDDTHGFYFEHRHTGKRIYFSDATAGRFIERHSFELDFERLFNAYRDLIIQETRED